MRLFFSVVVGGCLFGGWFCVFVCVVVLGPFLFSNCLIPSSSHKSCADFQVLVKGHWTYSSVTLWLKVRATTVVLGRPHGLSFPSFSSL